MRILLSLVFTALFVISGCSQGGGQTNTGQSGTDQSGQASRTQPAKGKFSSINVSQAREMLQSRSDIALIDVRSPQELREGKIEGSILIPFGNLMKGQHNLQKDRPIMLVCAVGGRSYYAGQVLARSGFSEVYNLSGGMSAWKKAGYPVKY